MVFMAWESKPKIVIKIQNALKIGKSKQSIGDCLKIARYFETMKKITKWGIVVCTLFLNLE